MRAFGGHGSISKDFWNVRPLLSPRHYVGIWCTCFQGWSGFGTEWRILTCSRFLRSWPRRGAPLRPYGVVLACWVVQAQVVGVWHRPSSGTAATVATTTTIATTTAATTSLKLRIRVHGDIHMPRHFFRDACYLTPPTPRREGTAARTLFVAKSSLSLRWQEPARQPIDLAVTVVPDSSTTLAPNRPR